MALYKCVYYYYYYYYYYYLEFLKVTHAFKNSTITVHPCLSMNVTSEQEFINFSISSHHIHVKVFSFS